MTRDEVAEVLARPYARQLMASSIPARLAYTGLDGEPRVVPVAFAWTGATLVVCTTPNAAKAPAIRRNPRVAVTIDTQDVWPPKVLLVRGTATVELVDGVPDEYVAGSRKLVPAAEFAQWEGGVRALYRQMERITIEPDRATLLDFETTIPKAVQDLLESSGG